MWYRLDSRMLESCGKIIKQNLWNCNGLEAFPIPMMPPIRDLVVALGVVGAILEAIFYRPYYPSIRRSEPLVFRR